MNRNDEYKEMLTGKYYTLQELDNKIADCKKNGSFNFKAEVYHLSKYLKITEKDSFPLDIKDNREAKQDFSIDTKNDHLLIEVTTIEDREYGANNEKSDIKVYSPINPSILDQYKPYHKEAESLIILCNNWREKGYSIDDLYKELKNIKKLPSEASASDSPKIKKLVKILTQYPEKLKRYNNLGKEEIKFDDIEYINSSSLDEGLKYILKEIFMDLSIFSMDMYGIIDNNNFLGIFNRIRERFDRKNKKAENYCCNDNECKKPHKKILLIYIGCLCNRDSFFDYTRGKGEDLRDLFNSIGNNFNEIFVFTHNEYKKWEKAKNEDI